MLYLYEIVTRSFFLCNFEYTLNTYGIVSKMKEQDYVIPNTIVLHSCKTIYNVFSSLDALKYIPSIKA